MKSVPRSGDTEFWNTFTAPIVAALKQGQHTWQDLKVLVKGLGYKPYEMYLQNAMAYLNRKSLVVYNPETKLWRARGVSVALATIEQSVEKR